ncbi:MAG: DUF402 domain-containing protein [Lachnospirales bacterium]
MDKKFKLYRKRLLPFEDVELKDDLVLFKSKDFLVTKWDILKKGKEFNNGYSIFDIENNVKVSKMLLDDELKYYYVDIVKYDIGESYLRTIDLLADVIIRDGKVMVVDLDEFEQVYNEKNIDTKEIFQALKYLSKFLDDLYDIGFDKYIDMFEKYKKM